MGWRRYSRRVALYRTYRPATFAEVVGQEHVTDPLSRALDAGRINHAYLFSGPRGCGKTSSARILARSLNCEQGPTSTPCGVCSSCVALAPGGPGNLDVIELDAASHGGVDDTRELRDRAFYAPSESRYRVFIVDEAHMVTNAGFNALLKIVEEPPEHLIFVFATTEPEKVLPTIRSRTHHYPFRLLAPPVMRSLLESICAREHVTVEPTVYPLVIRAGGGSPRDSLSILDQLLAGAEDVGVTYERALSLLGVTDVALIDDAVDALAAGDGQKLFETVERVVDAGHDPRRFAGDLLERLRDLILLQAVPDAADRGLVEAPGDQLVRMRAQIENLGPASLTRFAETAHAALGEMRGTTSPRLLLEVMCARMLLPAATADDAALLQRLERLESGAPQRSTASPAATAAAMPGTDTPPAPEPEVPSKYVRPSQRKAAVDSAPKPADSTPKPVDGAPPRVDGAPPRVDSAPAPVDSAPKPVESAPKPVESAQSRVDGAPPPVDGAPKPPPAMPVRAERPPTAPEPPSRAPLAARRPAPDTAAPPVDDIPLPDEPVDEDALPPESATPSAAPRPEPTPEPEAPAPAGLTVEQVRERWQDIRTAVRGHTPVFEVMLSGAAVHDVNGTTVVLSHDSEPLVSRLSDARGTGVLRAALKEVFGTELDVRCVHAPAGASNPVAGQQNPTKPAARKQAYSRPSRGRDQPVAAPSELPPEPEEPAPPRSDEEITDAERDEMIADAHSGAPSGRLDPDKIAMELLQTELGARPIE